MDIDVKDPKFLRWAGSVLVVLVVVPMYFMSATFPFTYKSEQAVSQQLEAKHQKLSQDLEKARLLVRNLDRVEQEYNTLHEQWKVAKTLLPDENQMPDLLRKVTAAGQQSGVAFTLFKPQIPTPQGFYANNPIEVSIEGGYHQTGIFLSRLANLNRIVNVSNLNLQGEINQKEKAFTVKTDLLLTAYTLSPNQGNHPELEGRGDRTLAQSEGDKKAAGPNSAAHAGTQGGS